MFPINSINTYASKNIFVFKLSQYTTQLNGK